MVLTCEGCKRRIAEGKWAYGCYACEFAICRKCWATARTATALVNTIVEGEIPTWREIDLGLGPVGQAALARMREPGAQPGASE